MWIMVMVQGLVLLGALIAKRTNLGVVRLGMQLVFTYLMALFSLLGVLFINKGGGFAQNAEPSKLKYSVSRRQ